MFDPIKGYTEVNLYNPALLPIIQCIFQCMGRIQKSITGARAFPTSKLGSWKLTTESNRRSNTLVIEIGRKFATEEGDELSELG